MRFAPFLALLIAGCGSDVVTVALSAPTEPVQADGLSAVTITATLTPPDAAEVLTFRVAGVGELGATNVPVVDGVATVPLYAPPEDALVDVTMTSTITAALPLVSGSSIEGRADVVFTLPTDGAPTLLVHTEPDRVLAGGSEPIKLVIEGRRLPSNVVTLSASSDVVLLPAQLELDGDARLAVAALEIPAPAERAQVDVTVQADGAAPVTVTLRFVGEGDAAFDLTGTFAQVSYGRKRISDFGLLERDPDCVGADALSLVRITQNGDDLTWESESCDLNMPEVNLIFGVRLKPTVTDAFIRATNLRNPGPMTFPLSGAAFDVPASELAPFVMGAELSNPVSDPLPASEDDASEADDDDDGHPGVTIPGDGGLIPDTYICSRTFTDSLKGTIESSDVMHGEVVTRSESKTFGSDFGSPTITDVPSPYHLLRVDGVNGAVNIAGRAGNPNAIGCDDVKRFADELRARFPAPPLQCE